MPEGKGTYGSKVGRPPKVRKPEHSRTKAKKKKDDEERLARRRAARDKALKRAKRLAKDDATLLQLKNPDNLSRSDVTYRGIRYDTDGRRLPKSYQ